MVLVIFLAGKRAYVITAPTGNIFGLVITCISVRTYKTFERLLPILLLLFFTACNPQAIQGAQN